jgi:hypothetical protein
MLLLVRVVIVDFAQRITLCARGLMGYTADSTSCSAAEFWGGFKVFCLLQIAEEMGGVQPPESRT